MQHKIFIPSIQTVALIGLSSCTAIPLASLQPPSSSAAATCTAVQNVVDIAAGQLTNPPPGGGPATAQFSFLLPSDGSLASFDDFVSASNARLQSLPPQIRNDAVTQAIFRLMVKTSAQAQIDRARIQPAPGSPAISGIDSQQTAVNSFSVPSSLSEGQLKDFANQISSLEQPSIVDPGAPGATPNAFSTYFTSYYKGTFIDRFGQSISKPSLSLTIPDTEIASAESVLVEYIADLVDPTPVLGDKDLDPTSHQPVSGTTFYPGDYTKEPTVLLAGLANYKNITPNKCGVTTANAVVLLDVANAAGDRAATISGLVSQSWGGISFGLGIFGKFSIGDNQTLGTIVKTAASRLGARASYAASYWALDSLGSTTPAAPGSPPPSPQQYLQFH